jgi:hypothetical protein
MLLEPNLAMAVMSDIVTELSPAAVLSAAKALLATQAVQGDVRGCIAVHLLSGTQREPELVARLALYYVLHDLKACGA